MTLHRSLGLAALLCAPCAFGSPFVVDSTSIASRLEIKTSFDFRDGGTRDTFTAPKIALAAPVLPDLELEVGADHREFLEQRGERTLTRAMLEAKWRFHRGLEGGASWALIPELTAALHESPHPAHRGPMELVVPVVVQKSFGGLTLNAMFGYGRDLEQGGEDFVPVGILARFHPTHALELGVEVAGESPTDHLSHCSLSANTGFKWKVTEQFELHGLLGRTVRAAGEDRVSRVKLVAEVKL